MALDPSGDDMSLTLGSPESLRTRELTSGATAFSRAMTSAFTASVVGAGSSMC